jgi:hypothetical protein
LGDFTDSFNLLLQLSFLFLRFSLVFLLIFLSEDWFRLHLLRLRSLDNRDGEFWLGLLNFHWLVWFSF